MNKFAARGLALEAIEGARIAVVVEDTREIPHALECFAEWSGPWIRRVSRVNGAERINFDGGGTIRFTTPRSLNRLRGQSYDVGFMDAGCDREDVQAALLVAMDGSSRQELVRA